MGADRKKRRSPPVEGGGQSAGHTAERIAAALLEHRTQGEAAQSLGVSETTVSRWVRHREDVRAALRETGRAALAVHVERARWAADRALAVLEELTGDEYEPSVRRAAAHDLLRHVERAAILGGATEARAPSTLSPLQRLQAAIGGAKKPPPGEGEG